MTRRLLAAVTFAASLATPATASASALVEAAACPPGDRGVIVRTAGRELVVCTNI